MEDVKTFENEDSVINVDENVGGKKFIDFKKFKPYLFEFLFYFATFVVSLITFLVFKPLRVGGEHSGNHEPAKAFIMVVLVVLICVLFLLKQYHKLNRKTIIFMMIIGSFLVRLCYMLYTEGYARQYDTWGAGDDGHFDYANIIYLSGKLPINNNYQFYHPPLNAFIQANFMKFCKVAYEIANKTIYANNEKYYLVVDNEHLYWGCQILSTFYITVITVTACKIFKELGVGGNVGLIGIAFILFFPRFIQLSGQLNNDVLCIMLAILSIYWAIKFYKNNSYLNIILLAVFIGLALMTKLNGAIVCLPIGILMVIVLVKKMLSKDNKQILDIICKYAIFLVVCAPIGLWFQVYAKIRFNQDFGYVFPYLNGELSTKHVPFWNRFFVPYINDVFDKPFANAWEDYNLWDYMIKSSLFGEFSYWGGTSVAMAAVVTHYLFHFSLIVCLVFNYYHKKFELEKLFDLPTLVFSMIILTFLGSQVYFYIKMPYGCTMDFRYVVPLILGYGGIVSVISNNAENTRLKGFKVMSKINSCLAVCLVALMVIFYFTCE